MFKRIKTKITKLLYEHEFTVDEIAERLKVSRIKVLRALLTLVKRRMIWKVAREIYVGNGDIYEEEAYIIDQNRRRNNG